MTELYIAVLVAFIVGLQLAASFIDYKYKWRLVSWLSGTSDVPWPKKAQASSPSDQESAKDDTIKELTERVQTLEKIVTAPSYELNQKINSLK